MIDSANHSKYNPAYTFGKSKKFGEMDRKPFISNQHVEPDASSPGPMYELPTKLLDGAPGLKFGSATRFYEPELGGPYTEYLLLFEMLI